MDEENTCQSNCWNKMVTSKPIEEWVSKIKSENSEGLKTNVANLSTSEESLAYINIKVELEDDTSDIQVTEDLSVNLQDPLLKEMNVRELSPDKKIMKPRRETDEERARRLAKMSAYAAYRLANESPEQRALRLKRMSEYASKRLAQETSEQRARRLAKMSAYSARRLANETSEQRQARLAKMSAYAARRNAKKKMANITLLVQEKDSNSVTQSDLVLNE